MPTMHVKFPDHLYDKLKHRANETGISMTAQLLVILSEALRVTPTAATRAETTSHRKHLKKRLNELGKVLDTLQAKIGSMIERGVVEAHEPAYKTRLAVMLNYQALWEDADRVSDSAPIAELEERLDALAALEPDMIEAGKSPPLVKSRDPLSAETRRKFEEEAEA